jgi:crotonobetainyl-CoA:carnitine CoA-transferase CaiB-like acyl-CoA transferase
VPRPLEGIRVLDLSHVLVGPYATLLLGDLGAEVIKLERPGQGDETRDIEPRRDGESHYFMAVNRGKKSVSIDLKSQLGQEVTIDLAQHCDVLVENFRPGVAARLGLGHEILQTLNPRLIYCSISAFGQTGPYSHRSALDIAIQAMSGTMTLTGEPGSPPTRSGLPMADLCGGLFAANAIQAALLERVRTGKGRYIDFALLDGMLSLLSYMAGRVFMTGEEPQRMGNGHLGIVPYGSYRCADGWVVIANIGETFWPKICLALNMTELIADQRYATNRARLSHRSEVDELLERATSKLPLAEVTRLFELHDVPYAPILTVEEALRTPQVEHRGMVGSFEHPALGSWSALASPIRFDADPPYELTPPPLFGEHTEAVLHEVLGYSLSRIDDLLRSGAVANALQREHIPATPGSNIAPFT